MKKNCVECGNEYETFSRNRGRGVHRFCGRQCRQRHDIRRARAKRSPARTEEELRRTCAVCSTEFIADRSHPHALTCSQPCSQQRINEIRRASREQNLEPRRCVNCETEFIAGAMRTKKFCSPKCQQRFNGRLWDQRHKGLGKEKNRKYRCGGNWNAALVRDDKKCVRCGSEKGICVHHIDGTGEDDKPNHDLENLATLCAKCHKQIHTLTYRVVDGVVYVAGPVFDWLGIDKVRIERS